MTYASTPSSHTSIISTINQYHNTNTSPRPRYITMITTMMMVVFVMIIMVSATEATPTPTTIQSSIINDSSIDVLLSSTTTPSPLPNEVIITEWPVHDNEVAAAGNGNSEEYASEAIRSGNNGGSGSGAQTLSNPILTKLRDYQLVRPISTMVNHEAIVEQLAPGDHPETLSYRIQAFGKDFDITLNKNNDLFSSDYQQIRLAYDPNDATAPPRIERTRAVHCYYHGNVAGDSNSRVTMSTCNGLQGSIQGHGEYFALEPASFVSSLPTSSVGGSGMSQQSIASHDSSEGGRISSTESSIGFSPSALPSMNGHPLHNAFPLSRIPNTDHLVYRHSDLQEEVKSCGISSDTSGNGGRTDTTSSSSNEAGIAAAIPATNNNGAFSEEPIDGTSSSSGTATTLPPTSSGRETIELLIFNDNQRWKNKGEGTEANTLAILNEMKQFYGATTFDRVVNVMLVGQVTFSQGDPYEADMTDSGVAVEGERGLLQAFHRYRNAAQNVIPRHDNGQLFSERRFTSNIMGLAGVGSMCSEQSGSITCMTSDSITKNAMISAHETGHTLTMMHDGVYNTCPSGGYIMQTTTGTATTFSTCSVNSANNFLPGATCLYNYAARRASLKQAQVSWLANSWSECSSTCGAGIQVRTIDCRDTIGAIRPVNDCNEFIKPISVRVCNASIACDSCALRNCSGIGVCRNGNCLCPAGTTGSQCEISISKVGAATNDKITHSSDTTTSTMALVVTATITGVALTCATLMWLCRVIQRHAKDRSMRLSILSSSKSHGQLSSSSSASDLYETPPPTPNPTPVSNGAQHTSMDDDITLHASSLCPSSSSPINGIAHSGHGMGVAPGLHKTPRSIPRSIAVKS